MPEKDDEQDDDGVVRASAKTMPNREGNVAIPQEWDHYSVRRGQTPGSIVVCVYEDEDDEDGKDFAFPTQRAAENFMHAMTGYKP